MPINKIDIVYGSSRIASCVFYSGVAEGDGDSDAEGVGDGEADAEGDAEDSLVLLFFVVEDFFGDDDGEADDSALELFFVVEVVAADDFFAVADLVVVPVWCVVVAVFEVEVDCFLLAHETKKASATTVIKERANLFIEVGLLPESVRRRDRSQAFNRIPPIGLLGNYPLAGLSASRTWNYSSEFSDKLCNASARVSNVAI